MLDEPTVGLDPQTRIRLWELVEELTRNGTTTIVTNTVPFFPNTPPIIVTEDTGGVQAGGIPNFEVTVWQGYAVPKATPQPIVSKIHATMMKALAVPELQKRFFDNGVAAAPVTSAEFTKFVNAETAKWKKVVTISGAKIE